MLRYHDLAPRSKDVLLIGRPDNLYTSPISFGRLANLTQVATGLPLLLLIRTTHDRTGFVLAWHQDPVNVAFFVTRSALDLLCPPHANCLHAANGSEVRALGCGNEFVALVQTAGALGIHPFFINSGWGVVTHRLDRTQRLYNMKWNWGTAIPQSLSRNLTEARLSVQYDLSRSLRCVLGWSRRQGNGGGNSSTTAESLVSTTKRSWWSACDERGPMEVSSRWGVASLVPPCEGDTRWLSITPPCNRCCLDSGGSLWVCKNTITESALLASYFTGRTR